MYSINVCDALIGDVQPRLTTKQVGKGIARAKLKHIPQDTYLAIFRGGKQEILSNKRIGSKLHTIYTMDVQKRGFVPYDDKRILLGTCLISNRMRTPTRSDTTHSKRCGCPSPNSRRPVRRWSSWFDRVGMSGMRLNWHESTPESSRRRAPSELTLARTATPTVSSMATSSWWRSGRPPRDQVAPSEWVTSSS